MQQYEDGKLTLRQFAGTYWGVAIVGLPMIWVHHTLGWSLDGMFLWFNFLVLWGVGLAAFVLVGYITSWVGGLIAIPIVLFIGPSVLNLFDNGSVYDLATIGIIVPLGVLMLALSLKRRLWLIPACILGILGVVVHSIGLFKAHAVQSQSATPIDVFLILMVSVALMVVLGIALMLMPQVAKQKPMTKVEKVGLLSLGGLGVLLAPWAFLSVTQWPLRFGTNLAIVITLLVALLMGYVVTRMQWRGQWLIGLGLLALAVPMMISYWHYNSALKPADLVALKYIRSLPGETFSCSTEINPSIYKRFTGKDYENGALPYVTRSEPMTLGTNPDFLYFIWADGLPIVPDNVTRCEVFSDGKVTVEVGD